MQRMTYQDLVNQADDVYHYELVRGEILRLPPPRRPHGRVESRLGGSLERYLHSRALAMGWAEELYPRTRTAQAHRPGAPVEMIASDGVLDGGTVLPGFTVAIATLFPER